MTYSERLRQYNRWRRGDERELHPDPRELGELIDSAADQLEILEGERAQKEREETINLRKEPEECTCSAKDMPFGNCCFIREKEREYEFEIWQDDEWQAGGNTATPDAALAEARHYEMMYGKDGPVTIRFYVKQKISIIELELEAATRHELLDCGLRG